MMRATDRRLRLVRSATSSPRIVIATVMSPVGTTGLQTHVQEVCRYLDAAGRPVKIVTPRSRANVAATPIFAARYALDRVSEAAGVVLYRRSHAAFLTHALRRELRGGDAAVVVYAQCPLSARAALDARAHAGQCVVMVVHYAGSQADEWSDKGTIRKGGRIYRSIRELEQAVIPRLDGIVFVSESARRALFAGVPDARTVPSAIVPNFVNDVASSSPSPLREPADLVTVGGLEVKKNHVYLLQVLAAAKHRGRRYTLDIIGAGPMHESLVRLRRELDLENQVRLHGRITPARAALPGHRAYVHASLREAFPYALLEAMAAGLPIIAGATGGIAEMLDDGVEGWFWPLDDADAAARVLIEALDTENGRSAAAAAAAARFARDFAAGVVGARLERLLVDGFARC